MNWGHPERAKVLLLAGDLSLAGAAMALAMLLHPGFPVSLAQRAGAGVVFMLVFAGCFYVFDLYDPCALNGARTLARLLAAAVAGTFISSFLFYFFEWLGSSRGSMAISVPLLLAGSFCWRRFYAHNQDLFLQRCAVLLIGSASDAQRLRSILEARNPRYELKGLLRIPEPVTAAAPERSLRLVAASVAGRSLGPAGTAAAVRMAPVSPHALASLNFPETAEIYDLAAVTPPELEELTRDLHVDTIVIRPDSAVAHLAPALTRLRFHGIRISTTPDFCTQLSEQLPLETLTDSWLSFAAGFNLVHARLFRKVKRLMDLLLAGTGLLVSLPVSLLAAAAIKIESPGPVLFRQWRVGWMERPFGLLKFRSMRQDAESDGKPRWARVDDPRITRVGRILRKLHIDELPQMINVLLGEMSFVGPRPERPAFVEQLKRIIPFYHLRHYVPPGITGWAQVNYPYGADEEDAKRKLQYDLFYIRNASPTLDLRILLRTARVLLFRRGSR